MSNYTIKKDAYGMYYYLNGKLQRENGPAIECTNGNKAWYKNGELHRKDGPAIEYVDGHKEWWLNGKRHREDGPAVEWANGYKEWYLNNKKYGKNDDYTNKYWIKFVKTLIFS